MFRKLPSRSILHVPTGNRCNNRCTFCMERNEGYPIVRSLDEYRSTLAEMRAELDGVVFTGGEPTLNRLLPELVEAARRLDYRTIGLVTNGRALQDGTLCERLVAAGLGEVTVSMHGPEAAVHDGITRRQGSFDQAVRGVRNLVRLGRTRPLRLRMNCSLVRANVEHIRAMRDFALGLGVEHINFNAIEPRGTADELFDEVVPRYREVMGWADRSELDFTERAQSLSRVPPCAGGGDWVQETWHLAHDAERVDVYDGTEGKTKGPPCGECVLAAGCDGIWARYVEGYGWDELRPIRPTAPREGRSWRLVLGAPCNNRCVHCVDGPAASTRAPLPHVMGQLRTGLIEGFRHLEIGGGEPLLDERLPRLARQARNLGYERVVVETNGRALNIAAKLDLLAGLGADEVAIRLNAGDEQTHDRMANAPGAFRQTVRAMLQLRKRGVPFFARLREHGSNVQTVERARQLALEAGARRFEVQTGGDAPDGAGPPQAADGGTEDPDIRPLDPVARRS
ncbi:MAG: radical SAM protein [Deltaproteobacteria bacterium]|jgi:MoaA/NifB/PqqE/SkfB family radical SAM enzyme|nr:radical SAM protein [Deltaproteobacteria bacterium]MBW2533231.1 radical SAM protein [Deltaproteobacteria bacterium]